MDMATQLVLCMHEQTQIVASGACRVGSQQFISYAVSWLLVSLLFIVISTFLKIIAFLVCLLFIVQCDLIICTET